MTDTLVTAIESGVSGYTSSLGPLGKERHHVSFANGHVEEITEREMSLMIAAYEQGRATRTVTAAVVHRAFHAAWPGPSEPLDLYADSPIWPAMATSLSADGAA